MPGIGAVCYRVDKPLDIGESRSFHKVGGHEDIIINTLNSMEMLSESRDKYISETQLRHNHKRLTIAFQFRDQKLFNKLYIILKDKKQIIRKEFIYHSIIKYYGLHKLFIKFKPLFEKLFKISFLRICVYGIRKTK